MTIDAGRPNRPAREPAASSVAPMEVSPAQLDTALGRAVTDAAQGLDPLAARARLKRRFPDATDELIRAATLQAELVERAQPRFGAMAGGILWSPDGLEQASRPGVAAYRARRLADAGVTSAADLTCGLGIDALAMAAAGITVLAVEQDPATAALAAANVRRRGGGRVEIRVGSCTDPSMLAGVADLDAWFVDPSRRAASRGPDGRHLRLDDPQQWSPPWPWVVAQAGNPRVLMAKAAPGLPHGAIKQAPGCVVDAEWVSHEGVLLETCVTWWRAESSATSTPHGSESPRRSAVILDATGTALVRVAARAPTTSGTQPDPGRRGIQSQVPRPGEYLLDPDPAVVRAGVVTELADLLGARLVDPHLAYVTAVEPLPPELRPVGRSWRILDAGAYDRKRLRAACAEHAIGQVEVTGRGRSLDPAKVRRDLKLRTGGRRGVLVVMGMGDARATVVFLCEPA